MATWIFKRRPNIKFLGCYTDEELQRFLRLGTISGLEMVKLDQRDAEWIPVYTLPWYREAVGGAPNDDLQAIAMKRRRRGPMRLLAIIAGVYMSIGAMGAAAALSAQGKSSAPAAITAMCIVAFGVALGIARSRKNSSPKKMEIKE